MSLIQGISCGSSFWRSTTLLAGAAGQQAGAAIAGMVDDEIQIGKVLGGPFQVVRRAGLFVERAQRQPLVNAQVA